MVCNVESCTRVRDQLPVSHGQTPFRTEGIQEKDQGHDH